MDYAKYTYVKLNELSSTSSAKEQKSSTSIEFASGILNMQITDVSDYSFGEVYFYGSTNFQVSAILSSLVSGKVSLQLLVDDIAILQEERIVDGETQVVLFKIYEPNISCQSKIKLRIKVLSDSFACTLASCTLVAGGAVSDVQKTGICMRVLPHDDKVLISYSENNKIYVCDSAVSKQTFLQENFAFVASGVSHCFATDKNTLYFFRVDASGNLFYSKYSDILTETKIDQGVTDVFARQCSDSMNEDMLICYIKNGKVMYCTMTNQIIGSSAQLSLPDGEYVSVEIADSQQVDNMFVLCTHKNKSVYILHSVEENSITTFKDTLSGSVACLYKKYLNFDENIAGNNIVEKFSASLRFGVKSLLLDYLNYLNNKIVDKINAKLSHSTQSYFIDQEPEYNYELSYNQLTTWQDGQYRVVYGGDCADWERATMDVTGSGKISDPGGLLNKWPFNKIKPCLMKNGEVIGYLDPNNYSKFEDGTDADITNSDYDVMVEFPKIYYKIQEEWDGETVWNKSSLANIKISISNKQKNGYVCKAHTKGGIEYDKIYISAYENFIPASQENSENPKVCCCSGLSSYNIKNHAWILENLEKSRGSQYSTFHIHIMTLLQILSMLLFQEYQGGYTYGRGYYGSKDNLFDTGCANTAGMFYGLSSKGEQYIKLFGLENIIGHSHLIVDGLLTADSTNYLIYNPDDPNCKLNLLGTNYNQYSINKHSYNGYLVRVTGNNDYGFLACSHVPVASFAQRYYYCRNVIKSSTDYDGSFKDANGETPEYMIYNFGGGYDTDDTSLFTYSAMFNISDTDANAERLVCYPDKEKS